MINQTDEKIKEYKEAFDIFDEKQNGYLSVEQLSNLMMSLGYEFSLNELRDLLRDIKGDSKPEVDFKDFLVLMSNKINEVDVEEEFIEAFRIFDVDNDGLIPRDELKEIMTTLSTEIPEKEIDLVLQDADFNNDGMIAYKKFVQLMLSR